MDLLQISRKVWLHRFVALPVIALTLIAAFYVIVVKKPTYQVSSSYVLINPPDPPTADEIARNPKLKDLGANNPYTRFADQSAMIGLLSSRVGTDSTRQALVAKGADPGYTVAPSADIGFGSFLLEITGVGNSPETAVRTAHLVGNELTSQLTAMQAGQGVSPQYMIRAQQVVSPDHAKQRVSGKLRPLIGVLVIGAILLFIVISGAEALTAIRTEWSEAKRREAQADPEPAVGAAAREAARSENGRESAQRGNGRAAKPENGREPARGTGGNNSRSRRRRRRAKSAGG